MQLGASMPIGDIGPTPDAVRDYAQAAESLGYDYLLAPDHVLAKNPHAKLVHGGNSGVSAEHAQRAGTSAVAWHDPFVMFGFLAGCTTRIGFATGVLVLPQRQAALVAKQAACLDVLSAAASALAWALVGTRLSSSPSTRTFIPAASAPLSRCR